LKTSKWAFLKASSFSFFNKSISRSTCSTVAFNTECSVRKDNIAGIGSHSRSNSAEGLRNSSCGGLILGCEGNLRARSSAKEGIDIVSEESPKRGGTCLCWGETDRLTLVVGICRNSSSSALVLSSKSLRSAGCALKPEFEGFVEEETGELVRLFCRDERGSVCLVTDLVRTGDEDGRTSVFFR